MGEIDINREWQNLWLLKEYFDRILKKVADQIEYGVPYELLKDMDNLGSWNKETIRDEFMPMQRRIQELKAEIERLKKE